MFGIITVHSIGHFCIPAGYFESSTFDSVLSWINGAFLENRFASIFAILFGISFYIILRKPNYPTSRFVWRCFLLLCIGLFNKFFYYADALMLYGLCGMILVVFRGISNKQMLLSIALLILGGYLMSISNLGPLVGPYIGDVNSRYIPNTHDLTTVLSFWPHSVMWYVEHTLHGSLLITLAKFILGYYLGCIGLIEEIDSKINLRAIGYIFIGYSLSLALYYVAHMYTGTSFVIYIFRQARNFSGGIFYAISFIYLYNLVKRKTPCMKHIENYGKLGLTNYTLQGILMVIILSDIGIAAHLTHAWKILPIAWCLFLLQIIFSTMWLKFFKNGPLEYLWRCATNFKRMPLKV